MCHSVARNNTQWEGVRVAAPQLTRTHRVLIGLVVFGAVIIAGIGFAGSYAAVRELALKKGFGNFSYVFPIGIDAGICVLLALDLLLTWIRIPFPLLRQTAWLLTAATIAFNGAAAWPDPLGVGMHGVIPILFVVSVEAARHAIGRIADITADKHMEGVRLTRWLLSPVPTFLLWRRMKLWELRSYEQVIKLEQERLVYRARLRSRFGRAWRRKAPVESLMPLRLARYGVPLAQTGPAGLAAAGIEPALLPPVPRQLQETDPQAPAGEQRAELVKGPEADRPRPAEPSGPEGPSPQGAGEEDGPEQSPGSTPARSPTRADTTPATTRASSTPSGTRSSSRPTSTGTSTRRSPRCRSPRRRRRAASRYRSCRAAPVSWARVPVRPSRHRPRRTTTRSSGSRSTAATPRSPSSGATWRRPSGCRWLRVRPIAW